MSPSENWRRIPILAGFNGSGEALERCGRCGSLVARPDTDLHDDWHRMLKDQADDTAVLGLHAERIASAPPALPNLRPDDPGE